MAEFKCAVTPETSLVRDLGLDSLAAMDLLMSVEDRFDVSIPLNALPEIETVGDLSAVIAAIKRGTVKA